MADIYGGQAAAGLPRYLLSDAARIVDVPRATVHSWVNGRAGAGGDRGALIAPASPRALSFTNLVELHVLRAMRRVHRVSMANVRDALATLAQRIPDPHPLATQDFLTDGQDLFIEALGRLEKLSNTQQLGMHEHLRLHLDRIERDEVGLARRLYPFMGDERSIVVDPRISFGRPVIEGTGVPIENVAERFDAGESEAELSADFGLSLEQIRQALRAAARDAA
ncbi:MAG: DUF433 domain-containing protein [Alphaproteobacteria bacterium]|nr:DUF433 domain-containing protein [Alphaproteobacteria bacterium]